MIRKAWQSQLGPSMLPSSVLCTEFEMQVKQLHLAPEHYVVSAELRKWCKENRNRYYIPEWLLNAWDLCVDPFAPTTKTLSNRPGPGKFCTHAAMVERILELRSLRAPVPLALAALVP